MSADASRVVENNRRSSLRDSIQKFQALAEKTEDSLKKNPYSNSYVEQKFDKEATDYGRPTPGSKTEARGIKASVHVCREIIFLIETINENAIGEPPNRVIEFGKLFQLYSYYSETLMGMLIRARKYGLIHFEGEMLYQRQDDRKPIAMLLSLDEVRTRLRPSGDPKNCVVLI
ncbi:unnamed protein product, partial [Mesorhabditis belari]|uniref:Costars domain-containing protein n=1 Tax=Mesorhabditis belari TaxID=2138241 RepID=A0AAF3EB51_9BILA